MRNDIENQNEMIYNRHRIRDKLNLEYKRVELWKRKNQYFR